MLLTVRCLQRSRYRCDFYLLTLSLEKTIVKKLYLQMFIDTCALKPRKLNSSFTAFLITRIALLSRSPPLLMDRLLHVWTRAMILDEN